MLKNLGEEIRECYRHAEDCARKAAAQIDLQLKADFVDALPACGIPQHGLCNRLRCA